jgi:hypothetical protein
MGNWYANIALRGPSQADVLTALREDRRTAFVSSPSRGCVVIYDSICRKMDGDDSERLAAKLTARFGCTALIALNADDDVLWLCVYREGKKVVEYDSSTPARHGASGLCHAFGCITSTPFLWLLLQSPFIFEVWRHLAVCKVLGVPGDLCTYGYPGEDDGTLIDYVPKGMFESTR